MPLVPSLQNSFTAGFKTEYTGLNFPENAATSVSNCIFTIPGDVKRRLGFNSEVNGVATLAGVSGDGIAFNSYKWKNVGGDGQTEVLVYQAGAVLYFYVSSNSTTASPLSTTLLTSTVVITNYQAVGNANNVAITECQFADGNGFLIVFHPDCDPFYVTFNSALLTMTSTVINFQIRDVVGIPEVGVADNFRPTTLTIEHQYNLQNQGWTFGSPWSGSVTANNGPPVGGGTIIGQSWTLPILSQTNTTSVSNGSQLSISGTSINPGGFTQTTTILATVTNYVTPFSSVTVTIASCSTPQVPGGGIDWGTYSGGVAFQAPNETLSAVLVNQGFVTTWHSAEGNYPSNSDVWWAFKDSTDAFNPGLMASNVQQNVSAAPKGSLLLNPWRQQRSSISGINGLTDILTTTRPSNGCWFQGRVFFTGVNASQQPSGDEPYVTWTENIYFSQVVTTPSQFGKCFQVNDPTNQDFFAILPTDGGVITIQGSGAIFELFPLENGLIIRAANGLWFITGSQGIGFSASDYTIRKISNVQSLGHSSTINVNGYPMFWNEEGIYYVTPAQTGVGMGANSMTLSVENVTLHTILAYYQGIPKLSKKFARGDYDNVHYIVQWAFRSTIETSISDRYHMDTILCFNMVNKAFYIYNMPASVMALRDIKFITYPGSVTAPPPSFKYLTFNGTSSTILAEENNASYVDWQFLDGIGVNYVSQFTAGYHLPGKALMKVFDTYIYIFLRNSSNNSYRIQAIWDYAINRNSGRWSNVQLIQDNTSTTNFGFIFRRHKLRGRGMALQIKVQSFDGQPFDVVGWSLLDSVMQGV